MVEYNIHQRKQGKLNKKRYEKGLGTGGDEL